MDFIAHKPLSYRCFITKINEHTFLLENVLTKQIWNIEILKEDPTEVTDSLKEQTSSNQF